MQDVLGLEQEDTLIGEFRTIRPTEQLETEVVRGLSTYRCDTPSTVPAGWTCSLFASPEAVQLQADVRAWIKEVDRAEQHLVLTTDEFGRKDLGTSRRTYHEAANHVADLAVGEVPTADELDPDLLSTAKGMVSRCREANQSDWYTVYHLFGRPPTQKLDQMRQALHDLRQAAVAKDDEGVAERVEQLRRQEIALRFALFARRLTLNKEYEAWSTQSLLRELHQLTPETFVEFVAACWDERGYETTIIEETDDVGIDVEARKNRDFPYLEAIQVKRWDPDGQNIDLETTQRYHGATTDYKGAYAGYLVTTTSFTDSAQKWAADIDHYVLYNGERLVNLVRDEDLFHVVAEFIE